MPADIDRQFARYNLPDHGNLLSNIIKWTLKDELPIVVSGPGLIDCSLYKQPGRMILHLVNLTSAATWRAPLEEYIPVGPIRIISKGNIRHCLYPDKELSRMWRKAGVHSKLLLSLITRWLYLLN